MAPLISPEWQRTDRTGDILLATIDGGPLTLVWRAYEVGKRRVEMYTARFRCSGEDLACRYRERIRYAPAGKGNEVDERDVPEVPIHAVVQALRDGATLDLTQNGARWIGVYDPGMSSGAVYNTTVYSTLKYAFAFTPSKRQCEVAVGGWVDATD